MRYKSAAETATTARLAMPFVRMQAPKMINRYVNDGDVSRGDFASSREANLRAVLSGRRLIFSTAKLRGD